MRSGGLLYFIILMVFAVILVRVLSAGNPDVEELNNLEFRQAVEDKAFVTEGLPEATRTRSRSRTRTRSSQGSSGPKAGGSRRSSSTPTRALPTWQRS